MSQFNKRIVIFSVSMALFMDILDTNILNTAIPVMASNFKVNPIDLKIALISYLLSLAIFIPISGWTADKYGAKRVFISALSLFTVSSFFCGYANSLAYLVISRSIQGIGGAFMISVGRLIIARAFERHQLVEAMNTVIIVVSLAVMLGPFIGGIITEHLSWPWIFWVNLPAGIVAVALSAFGLKDSTTKQERPFDFTGFILLGGSLALLCISLSELSESGAQLFFTLMILLLSICMFIAFIIHARKHPHPVINIKLLRLRTFRVSVFSNLFTRLGFGGMPFLLPLLLQIGMGFSAQLSGLLLVPTAFGIIFSKLFAFRILRLIGYKRYLLLNTVFMAMVLAAFQWIDIYTPIYVIGSLTFILGLVSAAQYTAMNSLAYADLKEGDLSASTSITSSIQVLAQTLGVAVGAIFLRFYSFYFTESNLLSPTVFHHVFLSMSFLTLVSSVIFIRLKPDDGQQMLIQKLD